MAIRKRAFAEKVVPVTVKWFDEECEIGLRPGLWTQELLHRMIELRFAADAESAEREAAQAIADSIAYWDIVDDAGERLPVTPELVMQLPPAFIHAIPKALSDVLDAQGKD